MSHLHRDLEGVRRRLADVKKRQDIAELEADVLGRPIPWDKLRGLALDAKLTLSHLRLAIGR